MVGKLITALLLQASPLLVAGFPHIQKMLEEQKLQGRQIGVPSLVDFPEWPGAPNHATYDKFDPEAQRVSTSGEHEWRAPGPGDIRGPCSGLNAAANHGYLPRDGIATIDSVNTGLWEAFGLDQTATIFLQTATMFFDGDPISGRWSIGYHSPKTNSLGPLGNLLGNQTGICAYGHLKTEADASITRGDWLAPEDNSNCASYPKIMQELLDLAERRTGGNITPPVLAEHSFNRKQHSIATNPNYFSPPYAGIAFTFGAHMFAFQLHANHSAEEPRGFLTPEVFLSFFGYTRDENDELVFNYGHERIPDNWYKRAADDAWTLNDILISTAQQCTSYPSACEVGGNTGEVNSFAGINVGDLSGGMINAVEDLSDPQRMGCFIRQSLQAHVPSFLESVFTGVALRTVLGLVDTMLVPALEPLGSIVECQGLPAGRSWTEYGDQYPGVNSPSNGQRNPYK